MDEIWILVVIVLILAIIVAPIISLAKIFAIDSRLEKIENQLKQLKTSGSKASSTVTETVKPAPEIKEEVIVEQSQIPVPEPEPPIIKVEELPVEEVEEPLPEVETFVETEIKEPEPAYVAAEVQEDREVPVFVMPATEDPIPKVEKVAPPKKQQKKESTPYRFENLLSKVGIVTLVLGIAFFVKYAIDKDWINEVGRVAIGVLTGGILIGIAHRLRKTYGLFSALLVGGGISVLYITITLAFREYHLFSQTVAFVILIAITIFSVILSLVYDRKELALFSLLGGYASPLMISTGAGNYVVLFSFLFILNSGMLIISMRKKWRIIGIVSFLCTQLFYWAWLLQSFETQYTGALVFAGSFFVQFYLLALFDHFLSNRKISPFQVCLILANNLSAFAAAIYIFNETEIKIQGLITLSMALVNAIVMIVLFRKATVDKSLIYLIIAIVLSFVSLAIPVQLNGHVITLFWAAEIVILLWLWLKSGIRVFQIGFLIISGLTLNSYIMDAYYIYFDQPGPLPIIGNRIFVTGLVVVAAFVISRFMLGRIKNNGNGIINLTGLKPLLSTFAYIMGYAVPFLEILYQFENSPLSRISNFTTMVLAVYTIVYAALMTLLFRKHLQKTGYYVLLLFSFIFLYLLVVLPAVIVVRYEVIGEGIFQSEFLLHYISIPAIIFIIYEAAMNLRNLTKQSYAFCGWLLVICSVAVLSVELDNAVAQMWATSENYDSLMSEVRTLGYPILWGFLAMILMIWGLRAKEAMLRQISLVFFAFIILKFYIVDIWRMSQTGRIISFVVLGIILLLVSFLIQKIKVLIKDDEEPTETEA